jgi:hypothetical protein
LGRGVLIAMSFPIDPKERAQITGIIYRLMVRWYFFAFTTGLSQKQSFGGMKTYDPISFRRNLSLILLILLLRE